MGQFAAAGHGGLTAWRTVTDGEGQPVTVPSRVRRIVSLVPSLTEAVEATASGLLVGATDWCTHPAGLDVVRVRGTKNPDVATIIRLAPDLVLANEEENRAPDLDELRAAGLPVYVTSVRTLEGAFTGLEQMLGACGLPSPEWLAQARAAWAATRALPRPRRAVVPIWRRPWMAVGSDTFTGSLLERLGIGNVLAGHAERYPRIDLATLPSHDLVVLPDEPYPFSPDDGPEAFPHVPRLLVPGRLLTWYGPSLTEAAETLPPLIRKALADQEGSG